MSTKAIGTTDKKYNETQAAAMKIVARWGVESYDTLPHRNARNAVSLGWRTMLMQERDIASVAATQHVARAIGRQRNPQWDGNCETAVLKRGRKRDNSGRDDAGEK